ncbi:MAG: TraI/MobA(P) family conjugative relaxase [Alphaproteobacteria bacterium]
MISKHIPRTTKSSFRRLAKYIAGAEDEGEKLSDFWIVNSNAGETLDDLDLAIIDIENTQSKNTRCKLDKTYHLLVSFKDEKPDLKTLKEIECEFAKALGIETHQRIVGTHQNTDNFHMHIAYNKINPETFKVATLSNDYYKRSKVCRDMEKKYNLKTDNGIEKTKEQDYEKPHIKAKDFEAKTWQQSFYSYVKEKKEPLTKALNQANKWQDLHNAFEEVGLLLKKRGNGLAIVSKDEKVAIKASDLDRSFSKNALEKRLGKFEDSKNEVEPKITYTEKPLTKHPNTPILWQKYQAVKKKPKEQSLLKKAFYTWKDFLMAEATKDPFAMAIIVAQKKLLKSLFLGSDKKSQPAVKSFKTEIQPQVKPENRINLEPTPHVFYVEMSPNPNNDETIKNIAEYDKENKFYYVEEGKDEVSKIIAIEDLGGKVYVPSEIYNKVYDEVKKERARNNNQEKKQKAIFYVEMPISQENQEAVKEIAKYNNEHKCYYLEDGKDAVSKVVDIEELGGRVNIPAYVYDKISGDIEAERTKSKTIDDMMKELKPELKKDDENYQKLKEALKTNDAFYQETLQTYKKHLEEKEIALKKSKSYGFDMGM